VNRRHLDRVFAAALAVALISAAAFTFFEVSGLRTVHAVNPGQPTAVLLAPGTYTIDEDPTDYQLGDVAEFHVAGPGGRVTLTSLRHGLSPSDVGAPFLDVGETSPVARFTVARPATYQFSLPVFNPQYPFYVSEPFTVAATRNLPCALILLAALGTAAVTGTITRSRRRASTPRPQ
jgi:hypothetical protein